MEDIENQNEYGVEIDFDNISIVASVLRASRNSIGVSNSIFDFDNSNRFFTPYFNPSPPNAQAELRGVRISRRAAVSSSLWLCGKTLALYPSY